jgi:hypothetical protein
MHLRVALMNASHTTCMSDRLARIGAVPAISAREENAH